MSDRAKTALLLAPKLAVSLGFLWWALSGSGVMDGLGQRLATLSQHPTWIAAGLVSAGLGLTLTGLRWWVFLRAQDIQETPLAAIRITLCTWLFTLVSFGALAGDAARILWMRKRHPSSIIPVTASIMIDHLAGLFGTAVVFAIFGSSFLFSQETLPPAGRTVLLSVAGYVGISITGLALMMISMRPRFRAHGAKLFPKLLAHPRVVQMAACFDSILSHWKLSLAGVALSSAMLVAYSFSFVCAVRAVGGSSPTNDVMAAIPLVDVVASFPVSVAGLGVREKTFGALMEAFSGMPADIAFSAALTGWLLNLAWGLAGSLVFLLAKPLK